MKTESVVSLSRIQYRHRLQRVVHKQLSVKQVTERKCCVSALSSLDLGLLNKMLVGGLSCIFSSHAKGAETRGVQESTTLDVTGRLCSWQAAALWMKN